MKGFEPLTPSLPWKCSTPELHRPIILKNLSSGRLKIWAEDETRTRDPQLGRLMLYQLSYFRIISLCWRRFSGDDRIRTYSAISNRFTVCPVSPTSAHPPLSFEPVEGFEPPTRWLQISCSGQLSYTGMLLFSQYFKRQMDLFPKAMQR